MFAFLCIQDLEKSQFYRKKIRYFKTPKVDGASAEFLLNVNIMLRQYEKNFNKDRIRVL